MVLTDDLNGLLNREHLVVVVEPVGWLAVVGLDLPQPLHDLFEGGGVLLLVLLDGADAHLLGEGLVDDEELPVELALVNEAEGAEDLEVVDVVEAHVGVGQVDDVEGVIVANALGGGVDVAAILPGLGDHSIVEEGGERVVAEHGLPRHLVLLLILHDGCPHLLGLHLHLGGGAPLDLNHASVDVEVGLLPTGPSSRPQG
mmetsp:Transcript_17919/g.30479  ORF Transcript_17919/g.30479 Transcript_17919/m.30479 type:complete len:200 (-) Transcript_17919:261-860(-)